jgi:hypothetical protein
LAIQLNDEGELDLLALSEEDKKAIYEKVFKILQDADTEWAEKYGPFELLDLNEMTQEEQKARLDEVQDALIWADVNYDTGTTIEPVEGLVLGINGWAKVPGRDNFRDTGENFLIAKTPWTGDPYRIDPVYSFAQCLCPFCEDGEIDGEECTICSGSGGWEFDI